MSCRLEYARNRAYHRDRDYDRRVDYHPPYRENDEPRDYRRGRFSEFPDRSDYRYRVHDSGHWREDAYHRDRPRSPPEYDYPHRAPYDREYDRERGYPTGYNDRQPPYNDRPPLDHRNARSDSRGRASVDRFGRDVCDFRDRDGRRQQSPRGPGQVTASSSSSQSPAGAPTDAGSAIEAGEIRNERAERAEVRGEPLGRLDRGLRQAPYRRNNFYDAPPPHQHPSQPYAHRDGYAEPRTSAQDSHAPVPPYGHEFRGDIRSRLGGMRSFGEFRNDFGPSPKWRRAPWATDGPQDGVGWGRRGPYDRFDRYARRTPSTSPKGVAQAPSALKDGDEVPKAGEDVKAEEPKKKVVYTEAMATLVQCRLKSLDYMTEKIIARLDAKSVIEKKKAAAAAAAAAAATAAAAAAATAASAAAAATSSAKSNAAGAAAVTGVGAEPPEAENMDIDEPTPPKPHPPGSQPSSSSYSAFKGSLGSDRKPPMPPIPKGGRFPNGSNGNGTPKDPYAYGSELGGGGGHMYDGNYGGHPHHQGHLGVQQTHSHDSREGSFDLTYRAGSNGSNGAYDGEGRNSVSVGQNLVVRSSSGYSSNERPPPPPYAKGSPHYHSPVIHGAMRYMSAPPGNAPASSHPLSKEDISQRHPPPSQAHLNEFEKGAFYNNSNRGGPGSGFPHDGLRFKR